MSKHYIFAYGSLINADSRAKTICPSAAVPVRVQGIKRGWSKLSLAYRMSSVGAVHDPDAACNGVVFEISDDDLPKLDAREGPGYRRLEIDLQQVSWLDESISLTGQLWTYIVREPADPDHHCPLVQSYIDVILSGCLAVSREFCREFALHTHNWDRPWIDDRQQPRYPRPLDQAHLIADSVDALLHELVPLAFKTRKPVES